MPQIIHCLYCQQKNRIPSRSTAQPAKVTRCGKCRQTISPLDSKELITAFQLRLSRLDTLDGEALFGALQEIQERLYEPMHLSFIGNFSVGKSNIINSLLGEAIAPTNVNPSTAVICYFRYGPRQEVNFHYRNGHVEKGGLEGFKRFSDHNKMTKEERERLLDVDHVDVFYPCEILRDIVIVDTPGFGTLREQDDESTRIHLREADVVCWVFDATKLATRDEIERITALKEGFHSAFALVNKCDEVAPYERKALIRRAKGLVGDHFDNILLYSADLVIEAMTTKPDKEDCLLLTMDLKANVTERSHNNTERLRNERAIRELQALGKNYIRELKRQEGVIDELRKIFLVVMKEHLDGIKDELLTDAQHELSMLERRLDQNIKSNQNKFQRAFKVTSGFFSNDYEFKENELTKFYDAMIDGFSKCYEPWLAFLESMNERIVNAVEPVNKLWNEAYNNTDPIHNKIDKFTEQRVDTWLINLALGLALICTDNQHFAGSNDLTMISFYRTLTELVHNTIINYINNMSSNDTHQLLQNCTCNDIILSTIKSQFIESDESFILNPINKSYDKFSKNLADDFDAVMQQVGNVKTWLEQLTNHNTIQF